MAAYIGKPYKQLNRQTGLFETKMPVPVNLNEKKKGRGKGSKMKIMKNLRYVLIHKAGTANVSNYST